jgi:hypothetical protein
MSADLPSPALSAGARGYISVVEIQNGALDKEWSGRSGAGGVLTVLSLGAGVQSSTLALMAARGEIAMPDCAVFADTQAEPPSVYRWLDWLESQLPYRVYRVTAGDLAETSTRVRESERSDGAKYLSHLLPAYTLAPDGSKGTWFRQCTDKHKLTPLRKAIDALRGEAAAVVWIGISTDEAIRMKPSRVKGVTHVWPLIDAGMSRRKCLAWMEAHGYPVPPRSSCSQCPYHSDAEWRRLRDSEPAAFAAAVDYERKMQEAAAKIDRLDAVPYLHASRVPLLEVDFSTDSERGQGYLFGNECEGMCGV